MDSESFARILIDEIVNDNNKHYKDTLNNSDIEKISFKPWLSAILMYRSLDDEQKKAFVDFVNLVIVDSLSCVLGMIDGTCYSSVDGKITLAVGNDVVSGDLQDYFLGLVEDDGHKARNS